MSEGVRSHRAGAWIVAALALLVVAHAAGYATTTLITDTARDLDAAWRIADGSALPLAGPSIGQRWHLGPAWFYVLAPILALSSSTTAIALSVGVLAALKIPLAWRLGATLGDVRVGAWFALLVALPGWASLEHVVFSHTNLAGTAAIAYGLAVLGAWRAPTLARCALAGLALALVVHAHPAALVLAPLAAFPLAVRAATPRALRVVVLGAAFAVPFVPVLVSEALAGWPALERTAEWAASMPFAARIERMPAVVAGTWIAPTVLVRDAFLPQSGLVRAAWVAASAALGLGVAWGLVRAAQSRRWRVLALAGAALAASALLALLREAVAFYFVLPLVPLGALAAAGALDAALPRARGVLAGAFAFVLASQLAVLAHRLALARSGEQWLPRASLADVARWPAKDPVPVDYLPVRSIDALARDALCARAPLTVHGDLATQLELAQGIPVELECGVRARSIRLGGVQAPHLAGLPRGLLERAGVPVDASSGGTVLLDRITALHPREGAVLERHGRYPPHPFELAPDVQVTLEATSRAGAMLAITELNPAFVATAEPIVAADGLPLAPVARSAQTRLYRCEACGHEVRWTVSAGTGNARWLDVYLVDATRSLEWKERGL